MIFSGYIYLKKTEYYVTYYFLSENLLRGQTNKLAYHPKNMRRFKYSFFFGFYFSFSLFFSFRFSSFLVLVFFFLFLFLAVRDFVPSPYPFFFFFQALRGLHVHCSHIPDAPPALIIPGGFFHRSLIIYLGLRPCTCVMLSHVPFFTIICIDMT